MSGEKKQPLRQRMGFYDQYVIKTAFMHNHPHFPLIFFDTHVWDHHHGSNTWMEMVKSSFCSPLVPKHGHQLFKMYEICRWLVKKKAKALVCCEAPVFGVSFLTLLWKASSWGSHLLEFNPFCLFLSLFICAGVTLCLFSLHVLQLLASNYVFLFCFLLQIGPN